MPERTDPAVLAAKFGGDSMHSLQSISQDFDNVRFPEEEGTLDESMLPQGTTPLPVRCILVFATADYAIGFKRRGEETPPECFLPYGTPGEIHYFITEDGPMGYSLKILPGVST